MSEILPPPPPPAPPPPRQDGARVVLVVLGALAALLAFGLLVGAAVLGWAHSTQRDDDGFYRSGTIELETPAHALTSERIDLGAAVTDGDRLLADDVGTARIEVRPTGGTDVFVGIGRSDDVDRYLRGVAHDLVVDLDGDGRLEPRYRRAEGTGRDPAPPSQVDAWVASSAGPGTQVVDWDVETGDWTVVVMNADGSEGVAADVVVALRTSLLGWIALGLAVAGALGVVVAAVLLVLGLRRRGAPPHPPAGAPATVATAPVPGAYPARLDGTLDPAVGRWLWLVKWLLIVPHVVVLAFLWTATVVLTFVAGVAILFTGRYPRSIFDFNVGVFRWTWRVAFYAWAAFGTDRYPPFRLASDPTYPADLSVEHPPRLSRGLVLVKWWLLALPHLLIVGILTGGLGGGGEDGRWFASGGLIGLLAFIGAVVLAVRGRYPQSLFDFVLGLDRWCFRVLVYVALMRDEYPPFRFDGGGTDPGSTPATPPAPPPPAPGTAEGDRPLVAPGR